MKALRYILWVLGIAAVVYAIWMGKLVSEPESDSISDTLPAPNDTPAAISLLGTPLFSTPPSGDSGESMLSQLAEAVAIHESDPSAIDGIVWHGRRLAYLGLYAEAIDVFTDGLSIHPDEPHLLRHRAHRYITLRRIDEAITDFSRAASFVEGTPDEVEPDGQPNAAGIPTSTLQTNIWYHLGLAYYLKGQFDDATEAFRTCFDLATNDDMRVAAADWLYMSLRRAGRNEEAKSAIEFISEGMELLENEAYYLRLLMYRGILPADSIEVKLSGDDEALTLATLGYGIGNWRLINGDTTGAAKIFQRVLGTGIWQAFGFIAAEADLLHLSEDPLH